MKYSIGEFASLLGVTTDTLRLYERQGILQPLKGQSNFYRYFDDLDARNLLMSRWYRSMEIPLAQVAELIGGASSAEIVQMLTEAEDRLEAELDKRFRLLKRMKRLNEELREADEFVGVCRLKDVPGLYRLRQTAGNRLLRGNHQKETTSEWMELLPYAFYMFSMDEHPSGQGGTHDASTLSWGLTLSEEDQSLFECMGLEMVDYLPPALCLTSYIRLTDIEPFTYESYGFMREEAEANRYCLNGSIRGKILLSERNREQGETLLEIQMPVKPI